jgi:hypothetical protein
LAATRSKTRAAPVGWVERQSNFELQDVILGEEFGALSLEGWKSDEFHVHVSYSIGVFCHMRREAARTLESLQPAVARSLQHFQPDHCRGFFRHAQYETN